ncbi:hypothetical protein NDU88_001572 [Pleurodeles waltl]|uniref:Uncharacterized protein n=1 Tax=Pleurodeles waltl TaxID=8319 RepID=A0AAV7P7K7_PLEWA|nr:hypothetical protein NDU88_001572 [Pleurodeles waltl]
MPPKGTKTVLPTLRGKQTKPGVVRSSGASDELKLQREAKQGAHEKGRSECDKFTTVRKKQKKRNTHSGPATHLHTSMATNDIQRDYTSTPLENVLGMHPSIETGVISFETIYQSIMVHREESKAESHRTQLACRKMQMSIRQVAKTCSEFATRMGEAEIRISKLKDDPASQGGSMKAQLQGAQWKLTDLEGRLSRNYLRVLGVPEGLKGTDPRGFLASLFKEVFPDLTH